MSIRHDIDQEIDQHDGATSLVLLAPEDGWTSLMSEPGVEPVADGEARYRGATLRRAAVSAVIPGEGF